MFRRIEVWLLGFFVVTGCAAPPDASPGAEARSAREEPPPFLRFRDRPLDYAGPGREEPEPTEVGEVRIGWFGPSEPADRSGGEMWAAAVLAVEEANRNGGYRDKPFRLVPAWSESPWANGAALVTRLAYSDGVWAVLGSVDGSTTHLAEQVVAKARLPLVSPVVTDGSVNLAGVPWMFSCAPGDHLYADLVAASLTSHVATGECFALLRSTDHDSRLSARELIRALAHRGCGPALLLDFQPGGTDFAAHTRALEDLRPAAVLVIAGAEDGARAVRSIRAQGLDPLIYGSPQVGRRAFVEVAGPAAEGVRFPLFFDSTSSAAARSFCRRFQAATGRAPDYRAAYTYDATRLLLDAIRRGGLNRPKIRDALARIAPWEGVTGAFEWDATGQNRTPVEKLGVVRNGNLEPVPAPGP